MNTGHNCMLLPQLWQTTCGYFWRLTCPNLVGLARYRFGCDACVRFPKRPLLHHFCTNVEKLTVSHFCKQFTKTQILAFTEFTGTVRSYLDCDRTAGRSKRVCAPPRRCIDSSYLHEYGTARNDFSLGNCPAPPFLQWRMHRGGINRRPTTGYLLLACSVCRHEQVDSTGLTSHLDQPVLYQLQATAMLPSYKLRTLDARRTLQVLYYGKCTDRVPNYGRM